MIIAKRCRIVVNNLLVISIGSSQRTFNDQYLPDRLRILTLLTKGVDPESTTHASEVFLQAF